MKKIYPLLLLSILLFGCSQDNIENSTANEEVEVRKAVDLPRFPSPAAIVQQTVGRSVVIINYSRPTVISPDGVDRTGKIWGKQVPFEMNFRPAMGGGQPRPWRAGANENTTIELSQNATIEGKPIAAGKYGVHMLIHENAKVTIIFSDKYDAWGSFSYEESEDALRVEVQSQTIPIAERLMYAFKDVNQTSTRVVLDWESKRIPFTVSFDTHGMVMTDLRAYLSDTTGLTWRDYNRAAAYTAANNVNISEGIIWIEKSQAMETNYTNLSTKSDLFLAEGKAHEAMQLKNEALELASTTANNYYSYGTQLLRMGRLKEAMAIYTKQHERWPDHWLTAHGFGRIYSAMGDYSKALSYEQEALSKAPQPNKGFIEGAIEQLKVSRDFN